MSQYHAMQDMVFLFQWFTILSQQQNLDVTAASMNFGNFCRVGRINTSRLGSWSGSRSKSMSFANISFRYIVLMKTDASILDLLGDANDMWHSGVFLHELFVELDQRVFSFVPLSGEILDPGAWLSSSVSA